MTYLQDLLQESHLSPAIYKAILVLLDELYSLHNVGQFAPFASVYGPKLLGLLSRIVSERTLVTLQDEAMTVASKAAKANSTWFVSEFLPQYCKSYGVQSPALEDLLFGSHFFDTQTRQPLLKVAENEMDFKTAYLCLLNDLNLVKQVVQV